MLNYYIRADHYMAVSVNRERRVRPHDTPGSTLTKAETLTSFKEVMQDIIYIVQQGHSIATPLVNILLSISGVFDSEDDRFDKSRHKVGLLRVARTSQARCIRKYTHTNSNGPGTSVGAVALHR